jgi:hypothetical protein
MKNKGGLIILLLLAGIIVYAATRKRKGSIEIGPLDKGEFINDPADVLTDYEKSMFEI